MNERTKRRRKDKERGRERERKGGNNRSTGSLRAGQKKAFLPRRESDSFEVDSVYWSFSPPPALGFGVEQPGLKPEPNLSLAGRISKRDSGQISEKDALHPWIVPGDAEVREEHRVHNAPRVPRGSETGKSFSRPPSTTARSMGALEPKGRSRLRRCAHQGKMPESAPCRADFLAMDAGFRPITLTP